MVNKNDTTSENIMKKENKEWVLQPFEIPRFLNGNQEVEIIPRMPE